MFCCCSFPFCLWKIEDLWQLSENSYDGVGENSVLWLLFQWFGMADYLFLGCCCGLSGSMFGFLLTGVSERIVFRRVQGNGCFLFMFSLNDFLAILCLPVQETQWNISCNRTSNTLTMMMSKEICPPFHPKEWNTFLFDAETVMKNDLFKFYAINS